ncbi:hypothetical protein [Microbacterium gorillae]|uniref:hypothetical protein n=1 Tax=Microbacterium gorillae TaxID=1231063 RepID=UPI00058E53F8|nr:hypothetical protein [Microbacterium gorillae]
MHRTSTRVAAIAALATAAALTLSGCSLLEGTPDFTALSYSPQGDPGIWMDPAYADGLGEKYETQDSLCGFSDGVVVRWSVADDGSTKTIGTDVKTKKDVWSMAGSCSLFVVPGSYTYLVSNSIDPDGTFHSRLHKLDIPTGKDTLLYDSPSEIRNFRALGEANGLTYVQGTADGRVGLFAFDGSGKITWEQPSEAADECTLLGTHIGCEETSAGYTVVDAKTGVVTVARTGWTTSAKEVLWATDGYATSDGSFSMDGASARPLYDFSGKELKKVEGASAPAEPRGALYPLKDFEQWRVNGVTQKGKPVYAYSKKDTVLVQSGKSLPDGYMVDGVATDGSALLAEKSGAGMVLLDGKGREIASIPGGSSGFSILDGVIVHQSPGETSTVYLPAGS